MIMCLESGGGGRRGGQGEGEGRERDGHAPIPPLSPGP